MRHGKDTVNQANNLIEAMRKGGVIGFHQDIFGSVARKDVQDMVRKAKEYHRIQEHDCNGTKTDRMTTRESNLEIEIKVIANKYGLSVHFDGDPRGYCVKLHTPSQDVYNTLGGPESGYGIG